MYVCYACRLQGKGGPVRTLSGCEGHPAAPEIRLSGVNKPASVWPGNQLKLNLQIKNGKYAPVTEGISTCAKGTGAFFAIPSVSSRTHVP